MVRGLARRVYGGHYHTTLQRATGTLQAAQAGICQRPIINGWSSWLRDYYAEGPTAENGWDGLNPLQAYNVLLLWVRWLLLNC